MTVSRIAAETERNRRTQAPVESPTALPIALPITWAIGLMAIQMCLLEGIQNVYAVDPDPRRRALATRVRRGRGACTVEESVGRRSGEDREMVVRGTDR